ncbi:hypothetical protein [Streptomyces sp. NPDC046976]|uniref:hypothetical protein n=1 Tax=Streptomyces sp. NPDC046976 TaxID=3155258 RepID=UPI003406CD30
MTTQPMPVRTMLPPNLTRHYYETRRLIADNEGTETTPWFRLTAEQRASVERDVEVFRAAIKRAEEEQDLVAKFNSPPAAVVPATEETAAEPCGSCLGCMLRATFTQLLREAYEPLGMTVSEPTTGPLKPFAVSVIPLDTRRRGVPLTREEEDRLAAATDEAFGKLTLLTAGIDSAVLAGLAPKATIRNARSRERAGAVARLFRQWEADGRPLNVVTTPEPVKLTPAFGLGEPFKVMRLEYRDQLWDAPATPLRGVTDFSG